MSGKLLEALLKKDKMEAYKIIYFSNFDDADRESIKYEDFVKLMEMEPKQ